MIDNTFPVRTGRTEEFHESDDTSPPFNALKTYFAEIARYPMMTREKERAISLLVYENKDEDAAQELVKSNLRLVVKIALEYYNTYLNLLDLIQEGNVGILRAANKYNPHKGTKFSSYAAFWIRAYILKYIMDSWSMVRVGTTQGQRKLFYGLKKETRRLEALGIHPESETIALSLQVKEKEVEEMKQRVYSSDVSLETPVYGDGDETIMDTLRSDEDVHETVSRKEELELLSKRLTEFKEHLNYRAAFIFDHRILSDEPQTLQEIATVFNVSREWVRQIEKRLRGKLKRDFATEYQV
jgi:RNA polymerase sigma-32 factor